MNQWILLERAKIPEEPSTKFLECNVRPVFFTVHLGIMPNVLIKSNWHTKSQRTLKRSGRCLSPKPRSHRRQCKDVSQCSGHTGTEKTTRSLSGNQVHTAYLPHKFKSSSDLASFQFQQFSSRCRMHRMKRIPEEEVGLSDTCDAPTTAKWQAPQVQMPPRELRAV